MKKITTVYVLIAIKNEKEVARTYALEFSHLPHCSFANADWSDSTTEKTGSARFYYDEQPVIEAIKNSKKYLLEQIERNKHLLNDDFNHEQQTDILCNKERGLPDLFGL